MPEYLATGRSPHGKKTTERIEAESADEAVRTLQDRGFSDVVLHYDDVAAHYHRTIEVEGDEPVSPRESLWFRNLPAPLAGILFISLRIYQKNWLLNLLNAGLLILRRYQHRPWGFLDYLLAGVLALPLIWAIAAQFFRGVAGRYNALVEASAWGRWEEVLQRVDSVGRQVPPEELAFRKAQALAGLGRLDEALQVVEPFQDGEAMPEWMYWARMPDLYTTAKRPELAMNAVETALELAPENATVLLDGARLMARERRDLHRARDLLEKARTHALSDVLQPFATFIEGMIRLEEGHPRDARPLMEDAFRKVQAFRHASPLIGAQLDLIHAYLTLACAGEGDMEAARRHYDLAKPRLQALKSEDLVGRCEKVLGFA